MSLQREHRHSADRCDPPSLTLHYKDSTMSTTPSPSSTKRDAPQMTTVERKLLKQIRSHVQSEPAFRRFLSRTVCGFYY